jgi:hypothetical protein
MPRKSKRTVVNLNNATVESVEQPPVEQPPVEQPPAQPPSQPQPAEDNTDKLIAEFKSIIPEMDKLIYEHNGRVRKANSKPRAKQPPAQPPVEPPHDDNDSVATEELDRLIAEYTGSSIKATKKPAEKVQCPDCLKEVSAKTMKYSHKKYCIKPVVEPEPAKDLQTNTVTVDATPKKAKAKSQQEKKPVPEANPQEPVKEEEGFATGQHQAQVYSTQQLLDMQRKERHMMRKDRFQSLFKKAV